VHTHFELVVVKVHTGHGRLGVGYTYPGGKGGRALHQVLVHDLAPALIGKAGDDIQGLWDFMNWHVHYVGRGGLAGFAVSALDLAFWDLRAKVRDEPLWRLLGGAGKSVMTYAGLIDLHYPLERHLQAVARELARGHTGLKIKLGRECLEDDLARARAIRDFVGRDADFMVEANRDIVKSCGSGSQAAIPRDCSWDSASGAGKPSTNRVPSRSRGTWRPSVARLLPCSRRPGAYRWRLC